MNRVLLVPFVSFALLSSGCISRDAASAADTAVAATGAAAIGYLASDGDAATTIAAGVAGGGARAYAKHVRDKRQRAEVETAYAAGEANATRELYDAIQRNQSVDTASPQPTEPGGTYIPINAPRRVVNGVVVEATTEYIRINDLPAE